MSSKYHSIFAILRCQNISLKLAQITLVIKVKIEDVYKSFSMRNFFFRGPEVLKNINGVIFWITLKELKTGKYWTSFSKVVYIPHVVV